MGIFDELGKQKKGEDGKGENNKKTIDTSSNLGRKKTTVETAKAELFKKVERLDPVTHISHAVAKNLSYYGVHHTGADEGEPVFLEEEEETHVVIVGSTGCGKGVLIGNKVLEAIQKGKGVIIVDPKMDFFLPQICLEELKRQGREDDLQVACWANNFGYTGINEDDTHTEIANKFIDALDLTPTGDGGVDHYRKNSRVLLKKALRLFFDGDLGVFVKKDFADILKHFRLLKEDMTKQKQTIEQLNKMKPNQDIINKCAKRYFDLDLIEAQYWEEDTLETLDSLTKSLSEVADAGTIYNRFNLNGALYEGKVLYLKVDMLDISSLKMVKMMITDAIQKSRRKKANTLIVADELSFYANSTLSGALATVRSMGLKFILAFQDIGQLPKEVRAPILSNNNVKIFYKISDEATLDYVKSIGGQEAVTGFSMSEGKQTLKQDNEDILNATRIRAMPRTLCAILVAESLPETVFFRTNFVAVSREFNWSVHEERKTSASANWRERRKNDNTNGEASNTKFTLDDARKLEKYRVEFKEVSLGNSDLMGVTFSSIEL